MPSESKGEIPMDMWLVTFRPLIFWGIGAVLVEAESEEKARAVVAAQLPGRPPRRVRRAPQALVIAAEGQAPLSKGMRVLRSSGS